MDSPLNFVLLGPYTSCTRLSPLFILHNSILIIEPTHDQREINPDKTPQYNQTIIVGVIIAVIVSILCLMLGITIIVRVAQQRRRLKNRYGLNFNHYTSWIMEPNITL